MYGDRWCAALAVMGGCVLWPCDATAQQTDDDFGDAERSDEAERSGDDAAKVAEPPTWLLGIGVSFNSFGVVGTGTGSAGLGTGALGGMLYGAGVERRLSDSLWLTGQLRGSYRSEETQGQWETDAYALDGQLGLRHVINPGDRFQVSIPTSLGAFYGRTRGYRILTQGANTVGTGHDSRSWGVHVDAGLALDFWVAQMVALRVSTRLLSLGHQSHFDGVADSNAWFAEIGLSPSFGVMFGF